MKSYEAYSFYSRETGEHVSFCVREYGNRPEEMSLDSLCAVVAAFGTENTAWKWLYSRVFWWNWNTTHNMKDIHDLHFISCSSLEYLGTPWAEEYPGSGRLTGQLSSEPVYQANGSVAPNWRWVGDMTEHEFYAQFENEQARYFA